MIIILHNGHNEKDSSNPDRKITAVREWKQCLKQVSMLYSLNPAGNINKASSSNQAEVS